MVWRRASAAPSLYVAHGIKHRGTGASLQRDARARRGRSTRKTRIARDASLLRQNDISAAG